MHHIDIVWKETERGEVYTEIPNLLMPLLRIECKYKTVLMLYVQVNIKSYTITPPLHKFMVSLW